MTKRLINRKLRRANAVLVVVAMILFASCSTTKYVEDGDYLLDKVEIKVENKKVPSSNLTEYLNQKPNADALFINKLGLHVYSLSGRDTSKKINRFLRKIGSEPVIYSEMQTEKTEKQLTKAMKNLGYLNAETFHCVDSADKKVALKYCIRPNELYTIREFKVDIAPQEMATLLTTRSVKRIMKIKSGDDFDASVFNDLSTNLTSAYQNMGYYKLSKNNFYFEADTSVGNNQVDVTLKYRTLEKNATLENDPALGRYKFNNITIYNGTEKNKFPFRKKDAEKQDTLRFGNTTIIDGEDRFIRPPVLYDNNFIRTGRFYNTRIVDKTYSSFSNLGAVSKVSVEIEEEPGDSLLLNAEITLTPSNLYHFQCGVDGTNSAGDLGAAAYVGFQQKNLFHGSEVFNIKLNGSFEHIRGKSNYIINSDNYYEYGGETSLTIPRILLFALPEKYRKQVGASSVLTFSMNWRKRPEYNRRFMSLDWKYTWYSNRKRLFHTFDLCNINYVVSPWTSSWFEKYLDQVDNVLLKESYKDQFITRTSYSIVYASDKAKSTTKKGWNIHASVDVAGTIPYAICSAIPSVKKSDDGAYEIWGTPFAQYVKATLDVSKTFFLGPKSQLVANCGLGFAAPYGNSDILPYEQRFYAGGANTVRGWSTRTLGPGKFDSESYGNFITQTGDVKVILNLEYRQQTNSILDLAAFLDAGNVWTVRDYEEQAGGQFNIATFYKEMGFSWGVGIRPNLKFLVIRFDVGMQIYNPIYDGKYRWVICYPNWSYCAFNFGIGYPF